MLEKFKELIDTYASKELDIHVLKELEMSGLVSFKNQGISRSKKECLLCIVRLSQLVQFKDALLSRTFDRYEEYEAFIKASGLAFEKEEGDNNYVVYSAQEGFFEIGCSIEEDGRVELESDDVKLQETFNIYLRVQH